MEREDFGWSSARRVANLGGSKLPDGTLEPAFNVPLVDSWWTERPARQALLLPILGTCRGTGYKARDDEATPYRGTGIPG